MVKYHFLTLVLVMFFITSIRAYSWAHAFHHGRFRNNVDIQIALQNESRNFTRWFTQRLDHFDGKNLATWQQKYHVNDEFSNKNKRDVAFVMVGGEAPILEKWMTQGEWVENGRKFNAILFHLEHRFYGESRPTNDTSLENLKYLTVEQALADLAAFIKGMNKEYKLSADVHWIVFGDSYSGSLASWAKLKYPQLIRGVVSSSAPLLAVANFPEYFEVVVDDLRNVDEGCYRALKKGFAQVELLLQNKAGQKSLTSMFELCDPLEDSTEFEMDSLNFGYALAISVGVTAQYNKVNGNNKQTLNKLCDMMTNQSEPKEIKRLANFNAFLNKEVYQEECVNYKYSFLIEYSRETSWDSASTGRQWTFQSCNELGFFHTSDGTREIFNNKFSLDFFLRQCTDIFGPKFTQSYIESATNRINSLYGGLNINVSDVVFVHGSVDPWHPLGIVKTTNPKAPAIFINGTAHGANIFPSRKDDLPQLKEARAKITELIQRWLGL